LRPSNWLAAAKIQAQGQIGLALLHRQRGAGGQHLGLVAGTRVLLGFLEQIDHQRPVLEFLGQLQGGHQALRAVALAPAVDGQLQGLARIAGAIQGNQLAFVACIE
jgi:hypothetical protein